MKTICGLRPAATSSRASLRLASWRGIHQSSDHDSASGVGVTDSVR